MPKSRNHTFRAITLLETELGLGGQPRAVVEHVKHGRGHIQVVWSRIDLKRMVGISDSHNYRHHMIVARPLEREFGQAPVQDATVERDQKQRQGGPTHPEMMQASRSGIAPQATRDMLWNASSTGQEFVAALNASG